jgi:hypothetical protein
MPPSVKDDVSKTSSYLYENNFTISNSTLPPVDHCIDDDYSEEASTGRSPPLHERETKDKFLYDTSI